MKRLMSVSLAAAAILCVASPLFAQGYQSRRGFWISGEAGMTYANVECGTICYSDAFMAPMGIIHIGGGPSNQAMISLELSYWRVSADSSARDYGLGMAVLRFYPIANNPAFLKVGAGVGRYGEERISPEDGRWALSANGFSVQAGAGYEFPLFSRFRFGPTVSYVAALGHKANRNRLPASDMTGRFLRFGTQITWQ